MGFRFQRRIRIAKWVTLNLSKSGVSASIGVKGARVTVGNGKERVTAGLPGTGVSYAEVRKSGSGIAALWLMVAVVVLLALVFS